MPEQTQKQVRDFGQTLQPLANTVFNGRSTLYGISPAGKSNTLAVISEEIGGQVESMPFFLLDAAEHQNR